MNASGFCAETIANRQAAAYATPKKSEVGPHPPRDGTTDPATPENPTRQSIALSAKDKNDVPAHSSDDGYPSCVGYCPQTIAKREVPQYKVPNLGIDHDIKASEASTKEAENSLNH
jgi:hypothetical protein